MQLPFSLDHRNIDFNLRYILFLLIFWFVCICLYLKDSISSLNSFIFPLDFSFSLYFQSLTLLSKSLLCTDKSVLYSYLKYLAKTELYFDYSTSICTWSCYSVMCLNIWKLTLKGMRLSEFHFTYIHLLYTGSVSGMLFPTCQKETILFESSFDGLNTGFCSVLKQN